MFVLRSYLTRKVRQGQVIPPGAERANAEQQRAERLAERLRTLGIDPDEAQ